MLRSRAVVCALAVGLLVAALTGISAASSGVTTGDGVKPGVAAVQTVFSPAFALVGFLLGAPIGAAVGFFWSRSGPVGAFGIVLVTLLGGFVGLALAAQLGAETHVTVTGTGASMYHGASPGVVAVGAALGMAVGVLCAWRFRPNRPLPVSSPSSPLPSAP